MRDAAEEDRIDSKGHQERRKPKSKKMMEGLNSYQELRAPAQIFQHHYNRTTFGSQDKERNTTQDLDAEIFNRPGNNQLQSTNHNERAYAKLVERKTQSKKTWLEFNPLL